MPLNEGQKRAIADLTINTHFPGTSAADRERIADIALRGFQGDYSPIPEEQHHPGSAAGTGVSFGDFAIVMARGITGKEPVGVESEQLGEMLRRTYSY